MCLLADTVSLSVSAIERPAAPNTSHKEGLAMKAKEGVINILNKILTADLPPSINTSSMPRCVRTGAMDGSITKCENGASLR